MRSLSEFLKSFKTKKDNVIPFKNYGEDVINIEEYYNNSLNSHGMNGEVLIVTPDKIKWRISNNIGQSSAELGSLLFNYATPDTLVSLPNGEKKTISEVAYSDIGMTLDNQDVNVDDKISSVDELLTVTSCNEVCAYSSVFNLIIVDADSLYNGGECEVYLPTDINEYQTEAFNEIKRQIENFNANSESYKITPKYINSRTGQEIMISNINLGNEEVRSKAM